MTGTPHLVRTYPEGAPCWVDLEVDDLDSAQAFYAELLGWSFTDAMPPDAPVSYLVATVDGRGVAAIGSLGTGGEGAGAGWTTYIAVDDADDADGRVRAAGGSVTAGPDDAGPGGRLVSCTDPMGVPFRLWQARRRPGAQYVNGPGGWNFSDLLAPDPEAALSFYEGLFGWRAAPLGPGGDLAVTLPGYGDHLAATVDPGIRDRQSFAPEDFADVVAWGARPADGDRPRWRVTFTVADRDAAARTAEGLGATVLRAAESEYTRTADMRDPFGAELVLSQYTPPGGS